MKYKNLVFVSFKIVNQNIGYYARHSSDQASGFVSILTDVMVIYDVPKKNELRKIETFIQSRKHKSGTIIFNENKNLKAFLQNYFSDLIFTELAKNDAFYIHDDDIVNKILEYSTSYIDKKSVSSIVQYQLKDRPMATQQIFAKDIMYSERIITATPRAVIYYGWNEMKDAGIGHLPIIENGKLINLISATDLLPYSIAQNQAQSAETPISEILKTKQKLRFVTENDTVENVIRTMQLDEDKFVAMLPVVKDETTMSLSGLVSWIEVLRHWNDLIVNKNIQDIQAGKLGKEIKNLPTLHNSNSIRLGLDFLEEFKLSLRHIIVKDNNEKIIKFIAQRDILKFTPLHNNFTNRVELDRHHLSEITPQHNLKESTIASEELIGRVVEVFLQSVAGAHKYSERIDGLLSQDSTNKRYLTYITPMDCIKYLINS